MHKNTKVTRPVYLKIKYLKSTGVKTKKVIRDLRSVYDILVSESTVNAIKRSKNYKQYRLGWKKTNRPLPSLETIKVVVAGLDIMSAAVHRKHVELDRKHWYSRIPIIRVWMEKLGL